MAARAIYHMGAAADKMRLVPCSYKLARHLDRIELTGLHGSATPRVIFYGRNLDTSSASQAKAEAKAEAKASGSAPGMAHDPDDFDFLGDLEKTMQAEAEIWAALGSFLTFLFLFGAGAGARVGTGPGAAQDQAQA